MIGNTIECNYDNAMGNETKVGSLTITNMVTKTWL